MRGVQHTNAGLNIDDDCIVWGVHSRETYMQRWESIIIITIITKSLFLMGLARGRACRQYNSVHGSLGVGTTALLLVCVCV